MICSVVRRRTIHIRVCIVAHGVCSTSSSSSSSIRQSITAFGSHCECLAATQTVFIQSNRNAPHHLSQSRCTCVCMCGGMCLCVCGKKLLQTKMCWQLPPPAAAVKLFQMKHFQNSLPPKLIRFALP